LENIKKIFDDDVQSEELAAVDGINLQINRGEFFTLLGPSGCGKTTTLRLIAGFEAPTEGKISIEGIETTSTPPYKRPVHTVFQNYALFPHMTVAENIAYGLKISRINKIDRREKVKAALDLVKLGDLGKRKPNQLSGGQQQRVALARALVNEPAVLLLDEPLGALDLKLRREMQWELKNLQQITGITFIYVTHDQEEALTMSDRIAVMSEGKIVQIGTPHEIYNYPKTFFVADFIGESNFLKAQLSRGQNEDISFSIAGGLYPFSGEIQDIDQGYGDTTLVTRPEQINLKINELDCQSDWCLPGSIAARFFIGADERVDVLLADGQKIKVLIRSHVDEVYHTLQKGDNVFIGINCQDIRVLSGEQHK